MNFINNFFLENIFSFSGKCTILKSHKRGYTLNRNCAKKQIHWVGLFSFNNFRNKYFWFLWIEFRSSCCLSFKRKLVACNEFSFLQNNIYCLTKNLRSHGFLHDMFLLSCFLSNEHYSKFSHPFIDMENCWQSCSLNAYHVIK